MENVLITCRLCNFRHGIFVRAEQSFCNAHPQGNDILNGGNAEKFFIKFKKARFIQFFGFCEIVYAPIIVGLGIN